MFVSRRTGGSGRWTVWKVGILFLGAGIWVAGVLAENFQVTAAAIIVVAIGLILSLVERSVYRTAGDDPATDEDPPEPDQADDPAGEPPRSARWDDHATGDDEWRR